LIFGEGEPHKIMQEEIDKSNLSGSIKIHGFTEYIYYYMKSSKAFILSSKWEEVGLVIVEAADV
jgi:Glycosyltransferase